MTAQANIKRENLLRILPWNTLGFRFADTLKANASSTPPPPKKNLDKKNLYNIKNQNFCTIRRRTKND